MQPAKKKTFKVWEGIFETFSQAKGSSTTFENNPRWVDHLRKEIENSAKEKTVAYDYPLPVVLGILSATLPHVNVLDFGGGLAANYFSSITMIPQHDKISYDVVELPKIVEIASHHYQNNPNLNFHKHLPTNTNYDLIHVASSLQYIEHWQQLITELAAYQSEYLLFADVLAGAIPSFVTRQFYYDEWIPVWFLNLNEVLSAICEQGYQLIFHSKYHGKILGRRDILPTEHFPKKYRLTETCHLLFKKI